MRNVCLALMAAAILLPRTALPADGEKPRVLILTGVNNHRWQETTPYLKELLEKEGVFAVDVEDDPAAPALSDKGKLKGYKALVLNFNTNKRWGPEREANFLGFVRDGGGLVVVHAADNAFDGWDEYDKLVGGTWRGKGTSFPDRGTFHPPYGPFEVAVIDRDHPITRGLGPSFATTDEKYTNLRLQDNIRVLAQAMHDGRPQPMLFVSDYGKGRMFQTALGHDLAAMKNPQFRETLARGTRWAARVGE
jgi:type 1 glutamine amidotransferase